MNDFKIIDEYQKKRFAKAEKNLKRPLTAYEMCVLSKQIENDIKQGFHLKGVEKNVK
ncbi:MAG: hypothetical protein V1494_00600 [Candidatus Diapherotrites archaeon]